MSTTTNHKTTIAAPAPPHDIVAVLASAGEGDYDRVRARIAELEAELDSLKAVEKILGIRLGKVEKKRPGPAPGTPKKPKAEAPAASSGGDLSKERRIAIAKYLLHNGTGRPMSLASDLAIPSGSITYLLEHPWFAKDPNGYKLSPEGQRAAGGGA